VFSALSVSKVYRGQQRGRLRVFAAKKLSVKGTKPSWKRVQSAVQCIVVKS
jgi:hypothetical protein